MSPRCVVVVGLVDSSARPNGLLLSHFSSASFLPLPLSGKDGEPLTLNFGVVSDFAGCNPLIPFFLNIGYSSALTLAVPGPPGDS